MKNWCALFSLCLFLTAYTAVGQIFRVPTLIHHFLEHVAQEDSSLKKFLLEHYAQEINHADDQHGDHTKLPFKNIDKLNLQSIACSIYPQLPEFVWFPAILIPLKYSLPTQDYSNAYLQSIWQPPRLA